MKKRVFSLRLLHLLFSLLVASGVIYGVAVGGGPLPPLGSVLNPGTGVWTSASQARPVQKETLHFAGLQQPVTVIFESDGIPHIQAATDRDLFWTIGYLQARFRLTQMDLMRRQGEGRLSEILGLQALSSDQFELTLGLERAAYVDWQLLPASARLALQQYSNGINTWIDEAEQSNSLPFMFKLLNYHPQHWTLIDTLVIQNEITQELDFSTTPLDYALLVKTLGYQRTMQWFPVLPPDTQKPYDTGSYQRPASLTPLPSQLALSQRTMQNVTAIKQQLNVLPGAIRTSSASNSWAVNGPKAANGKALMASDPHLDLTLPSIWYQLDASSPDYAFSGVSIPGVPFTLIGHNQHISWSMTNAQNQSVLFYVEKTSKAHPLQYYWDGAWRSMQHLIYTIPVAGSAPVRQDVYLTVHGPVLSTAQGGIAGETISTDWMGSLPSTDIEAMMKLVQASNFDQFRGALSKWDAPTLNFVYADDQGNIGIIAPGYYPIVKSGVPWLPLPGTGEADIAGSIPYSAVPQTYNPPDHMVFSTNQRPVDNSYPYYIGTALSGFDNGYRADEISTELSSTQKLTVQDMAQMQGSTQDYLAELIVPKLLQTLQHTQLSNAEQQAETLLRSWNGAMDVSSPAASIWWTFWTNYLIDTFEPWWHTYHVPAASYPDLAINPNLSSLDEDLETWTLHDPDNSAFTPPGRVKQDADTVMGQAFRESIGQLSKKLGSNLTQWQWGKLHTSEISSLLNASQLSYGPQANGGDSWTLDAAGSNVLNEGDPTQHVSRHGPSWRMIVDWGNKQAESVCPCGQDENPASPWYENQISHWWNNQYYSMINADTAREQSGSVIWVLSK